MLNGLVLAARGMSTSGHCLLAPYSSLRVCRGKEKKKKKKKKKTKLLVGWLRGTMQQPEWRDSGVPVRRRPLEKDPCVVGGGRPASQQDFLFSPSAPSLSSWLTDCCCCCCCCYYCCPLLLWLPQKQLQTVTSVSLDAEHSSNSFKQRGRITPQLPPLILPLVSFSFFFFFFFFFALLAPFLLCLVPTISLIIPSHPATATTSLSPIFISFYL